MKPERQGGNQDKGPEKLAPRDLEGEVKPTRSLKKKDSIDEDFTSQKEGHRNSTGCVNLFKNCVEKINEKISSSSSQNKSKKKEE